MEMDVTNRLNCMSILFKKINKESSFRLPVLTGAVVSLGVVPW